MQPARTFKVGSVPNSQPDPLDRRKILDSELGPILRVQSSPIRIMKIIGSTILVASRGCKLLFRNCATLNDEAKLMEVEVFPAHLHITCICHYLDKYLLVIAKNHARIAYLDRLFKNDIYDLFLEYTFTLSGWTKAAMFLNEFEVVTLNSKNDLTLYTLNCHQRELMKEVTRYQYKIPEVYCGSLWVHSGKRCEWNNTLNDLVVCSGTVFGEVCIWMIDSVRDKPTVLHFLNRHKGPVCSIDLFSSGIVTTSDDRSAQVFRYYNEHGLNSTNQSSIIEILRSSRLVEYSMEFYGHFSRLQQGIIIPGNSYLVTSSTDCCVCIWKNEVSSATRWELAGRWQFESPVRALAYDDPPGALFVGCDDSSIYQCYLGSSNEEISLFRSVTLYPSIAEKDSKTSASSKKENLYWGSPRAIAVWKKDLIIASLDKTPVPKLFRDSVDEDCFSVNKTDAWLSEGCTCEYPFVISFSPERKYFIAGNNTGILILRKTETNPASLLGTFTTSFLSAVTGITWISENTFIVSTQTEGYYGRVVDRLVHRKNIVTPCFKYFVRLDGKKILAAGLFNHFLLLGNDCAHFYIFDHLNLTLLRQYENWHGEFGLSSLNTFRGEAVSAGRDGRVKFFQIDNNGGVVGIRTEVPPFEWIDKLVKFKGDLICAGFRETRFELYSLSSKQIMCSVECGGAHRSYDFLLHLLHHEDKRVGDSSGEFSSFLENQINANSLQVTLAYVRNGKIFRVIEDIFNWVNPQEERWVKKVNCGIVIPKVEGGLHYIIIGCEDNLIYVFRYNTEAHVFVKESAVAGHISGVRCLKFVPYSDRPVNSGLLMSGGGRSELIIWQLWIGRGIRCARLCSITLVKCQGQDLSDFRILDIQVVQREKFHGFIFASCSDGKIYVLRYTQRPELNKCTLTKVTILEAWNDTVETQHAITQVFVHEAETNTYVFGVSTGGKLLCWKLDLGIFLDDKIPLLQFSHISSYYSTQFHNTPITSMLCLEIVSFNFTFVFGYENGLLQIMKVTEVSSNSQSLSEHFQVSQIWSDDKSHASSILAIVPGDQKLGETPYRSQDNESPIQFIACSSDQVVTLHRYDSRFLEMRAGITDCQALIYLPELKCCIFLGDGVALFEFDKSS